MGLQLAWELEHIHTAQGADFEGFQSSTPYYGLDSTSYSRRPSEFRAPILLEVVSFKDVGIHPPRPVGSGGIFYGSHRASLAGR